MTTKELEKQIVKAIKEESKIPLASGVGYKELIKLVFSYGPFFSC